MNTASCRSAITYLDGEAGILAVPRLPDRAARREVHLHRGRLPARARRAADRKPARGVVPRDHDPHLRPREHQELHAGLPLRRPSDGHAARVGGRAVDLLPRRQRDQGRGAPLPPDHPPDRQDADPRRLRLPPLRGPALRLSGQRPALPRQLPRDALQDDRAQVRARSRAWSARSTSSSSCTPTTSRTARRAPCAASARRRSTPTRRSPPASPRSTARCTAAPTRQSCACSAASRARTTSPTSSRA